MASMANDQFGTPCKHKDQGIFALTLTCPHCRLIRQLQSEDQQHQPTKKKDSKKANKKAKIDARKLKKYGN